jgi:hypothetical protein
MNAKLEEANRLLTIAHEAYLQGRNNEARQAYADAQR